MPAKRTHNIPFSEFHYEVMEDIHKVTGDRYADINRRVWDEYTERHPEVTLEYQKRKVKDAERQLEIERSRETSIEQIASKSPLLARTPKVTGQRNEPAPLTDIRPAPTEEERFLRAAPYVANGDAVVTPEMKMRVLDQARQHPQWLEKVQEPERNKLEAMLRIPKAGGRG
jgi:hypothetical protein